MGGPTRRALDEVYAVILQACSGSPNLCGFLDAIIFNSWCRVPGTTSYQREVPQADLREWRLVGVADLPHARRHPVYSDRMGCSGGSGCLNLSDHGRLRPE